jgi:hypothetical protein
MTLPELAGVLAAFSAVITLIIFIGGKLLRLQADAIVNRIVQEYLSELKPNGGKSLKDSIRRIESTVSDVKVDLSRLEGQFQQHMVENK